MIASLPSRRLLALALVAACLPLAALAAGLQTTIDGQVVTFEDVPENAWFAPFVRKGTAAGIATGYKDAGGALLGTFGPGDPVTIGQAFKMVVNGAEYATAQFHEGAPAHWADPFAAVMIALGSGVVAGGYELDAPATRAQVAQLVTEAFGLFVFGVTFPEEYVDVPLDHPFAAGIEAMLAGQIMVGDNRIERCPEAEGCEKTTFRPDDSISRAEILKAVVIAREKYGTFGHGVTPESLAAGPLAPSPVPILSYRDNGFFPFTLVVEQGTEITFLNLSSGELKLESDPAYFVYPALDETRAIPPGNSLRLRFDEAIDLSIRSRNNPFDRALVIVRDSE